VIAACLVSGESDVIMSILFDQELYYSFHNNNTWYDTTNSENRQLNFECQMISDRAAQMCINTCIHTYISK
jgi:hypothetical protein